MAEESNIQKLVKPLTRFQIGLMIIIFGLFLYMSNITTPIPNLINSTNETYGVLYSPIDLVPPTYIPFEYAIGGIFLVCVLVLSFLLLQQRQKTRMGEREAKELIMSEFEKKKSIPLASGKVFEAKNYEVVDILSCITPYYREGAERKPRYIAVGLQLLNKQTDVEDFYKVRVNPYDRLIDDILPTTRELIDAEKCPKCGSEFDEKPITAEDLYKAKKAVKFMEK